MEVSYERAEAVVKYDDEKVTVNRLRGAIDATGFKAKGVVPEKKSVRRRAKVKRWG